MGTAADLNTAKVKKDALRDQIAQFHERSSSVLYLSLQWKDLDDHYNAVHEALERTAEGLRFREEALREVYREVEVKQHEFRCLEELIEFRCKELDLQAEELGEKYRAAIEEKGGEIEREIQRRLMEIEEKEKSFQLESLSVQTLIDERFREVARKEKQLAQREKQFADKFRNFEAERVKVKDWLGEVQSREKQFEGRLREFELETLEFESERERLSQLLKEVESKDRQAEHRLRDLESKNKELEERRKGLESHIERLDLDRRKFGEEVKAVESREKRIEERAKVLDLKSAKLELRLQEIESDRTIYFVERGIFDVKLRELESDKRKFESVREKLDGLLREVELKDKQSNERAEKLEAEFKQLESNRRIFEEDRGKLYELLRELEVNKRELDSGKERLNEQWRELDLKDEQVEGQNKELETSRRGIEEEQAELFKLAVRDLDERSREVELKSNQREEKLQGFQDPRLRGCLTVDGKNLQVLLNECRNDHKKVENEVYFLLRMSHDPAKVVLDAMQGFFPPHLKKRDVEFKGSNVRASCIFLLELLLNISPDIKEDVKSEALKLSFDWMTKLRPDWEHASHILGFLLLVASYKLRSAFDDYELISYAKVIARWRQVPGLCRMLGFREEMQGFIQDLLKRKEHMTALRFASTFDLLSNFPPDPIIKEFMEISSGAFKAIFDNENSLVEAKTQAKYRRISDLKAAKLCIEEQKLKCGYCPTSIKLEILSLEKQPIDQRKAAEEVGNGVKIHGLKNNNDKVCSPPRIPSVPSSMPLSADCLMSEKVAVVVASDTPSQQQNMEHSQRQAVLSAPADSNKPVQSLAPKLEQQAAVLTVQDDHLPKEYVIEDVRSTSSRNCPTELQCCPVVVPGEGLRILLRGDLEDTLVQHKVSNVLESSSDPADLVFDAIQGPRSSISGKDGSSCKLGIPVKQSILLLKELKRVAYALNPSLKKKAIIFAKLYRLSLKTTKNNHMGVIFLLQFCTVYKVWLSDVDEVISLLDPSIWRKEVPESCQLFGLQEDCCLSLIWKSQRFNAKKYAEDMEKKKSEEVREFEGPRCGRKRKASECCEERDTSQPASSVTASCTSKPKSQSEWQNKRKTKFIDYSDPGINCPPHRKPYPRKPWFHKKMLGAFMDSNLSRRGRAQFLPQEEDDLYHPYFTNIHHQGR